MVKPCEDLAEWEWSVDLDLLSCELKFFMRVEAVDDDDDDEEEEEDELGGKLALVPPLLLSFRLCMY